MSKRQVVAGVMLVVGALLMAGSLGTAEFTDDFGRGFLARTIIGVLLIFFAIPISGDLEDE